MSRDWSRLSAQSTIQGHTVMIGLDGVDTVMDALGDLKNKTPAVLKVAANQTTRQARRWMLSAARARYAVNAAGMRHLQDLRQQKRATNQSPSATLRISKMRADLGYFDNDPRAWYTGLDVFRYSPEYYRARVLTSSQLKALPAGSGMSKAFLIEFKNDGVNTHVGMVQRVLGSSSSHTRTRSGRERWRNAQGNVEKLQTMGAPSAAAMHHVIWPTVSDDVEDYFVQRVQERVDWVLARAAARRRR